MSLYFRNSTNSTVQLALFYADGARCGISIVDTRGILAAWYRFSPGQTIELIDVSVGGREFLYYAETVPRNLIWQGNTRVPVPRTAFKGCWGFSKFSSLCNNCRWVHMRQFVVPSGLVNYTVNLISSNNQRKSIQKNVIYVLPTKVTRMNNKVIRSVQRKRVKNGSV